MTKVKKIVKKVKKAVLPVWCTEIRITEKDFLENVPPFYECFNVPLCPQLVALKLKYEAGGFITLEDQKLIARTLAADIAKQTLKVFKDEMFDKLAISCAQTLVDANKGKKKS